MVDGGAEFTPRQRKIRSEALQGGRSGEGVICSKVEGEVDERSEGYDICEAKTSMVLACRRGEEGVGRKLGLLPRGNLL